MLKNSLLFAFISLIAVSVNAQNMSLSTYETNKQAISNYEAKSDPFTGLEIELRYQIENPCEDSVYLELKKMDLNKMTDREYELYKQKDQACNEYLQTERLMNQLIKVLKT